MISKVFTSEDISVMYDSNEGLYYLDVKEGCTQDYTKEELTSLLKSIIDSLGFGIVTGKQIGRAHV